LNARLRVRAALRICGALASAGVAALTSAAVQAANATPFAAPTQQVLPSSSGSLLRVTFALLLVLAAVLGAAWLARRVRGFSAGNSPSIQVLSQLSLGARERAVLVRVGTQQLLLGVAPGSVRTLHVLEQDATAGMQQVPSPPTAPQPPSFKSLLLKSLGK